MHATETILFRDMRLIIGKAHVKFQLDLISSFQGKMEQTDKQKDKQTNIRVS